jgi:hypothetical protein
MVHKQKPNTSCLDDNKCDLPMKKSSIDGKQYLDYLWEPSGLSGYI